MHFINGMNDLENNTVELVGVAGSGNNRAPMHWQVTQGTNFATVSGRVLPSLTAGAFVTPRDVNNHGVIVGSESIGSDPGSTPQVWSSGLAAAAVRLPVPDLYEPNSSGIADEDTSVCSISDDGIIVGLVRQSNVTDPLTWLIFWKVELVEGSVVISDVFINNANELLTYQWAHSSSGGGLARPKDALCVIGGAATDLSSFTSTWVVGSATDNNHDGWIAGRIRNVNSVEVPTVIIR